MSLQMGNFFRTETGYGVSCPTPGCPWLASVSQEAIAAGNAAVVDEAERALADHRHADHPLRLNLGGGEDRREGFVTVDLRVECADVVAPVDDLPYAAGEADELLALDVLEHFWRDDVPRVLAEWHRVLVDAGTLTLRVPNMLALSRQLVDADSSAFDPARSGAITDKTIENIYGGHRFGPGGSWDTHHWGYTPTSIERALEQAGFAVQSNDQRHNMTIVARKR